MLLLSTVVNKYLTLRRAILLLITRKINNKKNPTLLFSDELHLRYKKYTYTLFNKCNFSTKFYIADMMLFKKANINTLLSILKEGFQVDKINSDISKLIDIQDFGKNCVTSEYKLYSFYYRNILCQNYQSLSDKVFYIII